MNAARAMMPHLRIGFWLLICALAVNGVLQLLAHTPLLAWVPQKISGTGFVEDSRDRVAGASREFASGELRPDDCLTVIIGLSEVREATNLDLIKSRLQFPCHLMALTGAGGRMEDVAPHVSTLMQTKLRPTLAVIGFGPAMLLDQRVARSNRIDAQEWRPSTLRELVIAVRNSFWVYSRRADLRLTLDESLQDLRAYLFRTLGVQVEDVSAVKRSPWRGTIRLMGDHKYSEATLQKDIEWFETIGSFDPNAYKESWRQSDILKDIILGFRERGAAVMLVLTPEHSRLRERVPPTALEAVQATLPENAGSSVVIVDWRALLDDANFVDLKHPNDSGSNKISAALAAEIQKSLELRMPK